MAEGSANEVRELGQCCGPVAVAFRGMTFELEPWWELDLSESGIEYDNDTRVVRDLRSGESIGLDKFMVGTGKDFTAKTVDHMVRVRGKTPPGVGTWRKVEPT
ncbi:hypothetical protein [Nocardia brevicatena]|uniref:hypothetical protein n=1 Tax=Nocardia brevicatena TaxID=37327 RepID=UPI001C3F3E54|nr:hypothetical protein [Nocardia brevicatena]